MAGTADLVLRGFGGVAVRDDALWFDPLIPEGIKRLGFELTYRGQRLRVDVTPTSLRLHQHPRTAAPIKVVIHGTAMR